MGEVTRTQKGQRRGSLIDCAVNNRLEGLAGQKGWRTKTLRRMAKVEQKRGKCMGSGRQGNLPSKRSKTTVAEDVCRHAIGADTASLREGLHCLPA